MKKSRFSEEKIVKILQEAESGVSVADLCRKHGISDAEMRMVHTNFSNADFKQTQ